MTMYETIDPFDVKIPRTMKLVLNPKTEVALLKSPSGCWPPIVVRGGYLIDGLQRVLVARKYKYQSIPFREI